MDFFHPPHILGGRFTRRFIYFIFILCLNLSCVRKINDNWPSQCDRKRICLATSTQPYSQHTIVYTVSTNKIYRVDTESTNIIQLKKKSIRIGKFPLAPMDILASGSAHARPSAQPPHQLQRKKIVARVYKFTFKHLPQHLRSHNQSFGTLGQL